MLVPERQQRIQEVLRQNGSVTVRELSRLLGVSESTVRRDLQRLARQGVLSRTYGGAVAAVGAEMAFSERAKEQAAEKRAIGRTAAALVRPGETVIIDAGTTALEVARALRGVRDLRVITNSLPVAWELTRSSCELILVGGEVRMATLALVGPLAVESLRRLAADRAFIGANGVDLRRGLTTPSLIEAEVKRAMIEAAKEVVVVADRTKLGAVTMAAFARLDEVHRLITDPVAAPEFVRSLREAGIDVVLADEA